MSKTAKTWSTVAAVAALLIAGVMFYVWSSGRSERTIASLRSQLAQDDLSTSERNALKTHLMRTVDEMDRDKLRAMSASLREQRRARSAEQILDFHAASESEKLTVLDAAIAQLAAERDFNSAINGGGRRRGGRRRNPGANNRVGNQRQGDQAGRAGDRNAGNRNADGQGNAAGERRRGGGDRQRGGENLSEEQLRQRTEYFEALRARAEELGVEIEEGRGRRRR